MVAEIITLSWEVYPFRMPELISHKVQVGLPTQGNSKKSDHLVDRDTSVYNDRLSAFLHVRIDFTPKKPLCNSLITNDRLVMGLAISNTFFLPSTVCHTVDQLTHIPLFVFQFL